MVNKICLLRHRHVLTDGAQDGERIAMTTADSRIPCAVETRKRIKARKRGGETYDDVLRKMLAQYNPDEKPS